MNAMDFKVINLNELYSLNSQCAKFQGNVMLISVFKIMLKFEVNYIFSHVPFLFWDRIY